MTRTVLLLEPPFHRLFKNTYSLHRFPLALGYLANAVRRHTDWRVLTHNADFNPADEPLRLAYLAGEGFNRYRNALDDPHTPAWTELHDVLQTHRPDVLAVSTKTQTYPAACRAARLAKHIRPDTVVLLGGPHPSMNPAASLDCPHVDAVALGEGEQTIVDFLRAVETHRPWRSVPGLCLREGDSTVTTPPRPLIEDLDALGFAHESARQTLIGYDRYPPTAFRFVFAIRGCPFGCVFCGSRHLWSRRVRYRSPQHVAAELSALQDLGLRFVHFDDDTFGVRADYIHALCHAVRSICPDLRWSCELHVNLVNDDILRTLRRAGCYRVQVGIESGSDAILRGMRKGFTVDRALTACRAIRRAGLELHAFFMVGFARETETTLAETLDVMRRIHASRILYSIFTPYPGTEAFDLCRQLGLIEADPDLVTLYHQSPTHCFTPHIPRERFRQLLEDIERTVDRRNARARIAEIISPRTLRRVAEVGPRAAIRKAWQLLRRQ